MSTAYLHADVETELYMTQPQGFEVKGPNRQTACLPPKEVHLRTQTSWLKLEQVA